MQVLPWNPPSDKLWWSENLSSTYLEANTTHSGDAQGVQVFSGFHMVVMMVSRRVIAPIKLARNII